MKQTEAILGDMRFIPLKGVVLILILILTTSRVHAQYALGATGQMMIPTAEMQETGTFMWEAQTFFLKRLRLISLTILP